MVWWRGDDGIPENAKILALEGPLSFALWVMAGIVSNRELTDGILTQPRIDYAVLRSQITKGVPAAEAASVVDAAVKDLVRVRLWHSTATVRKCDDCAARLDDDGGGLPKGAYYIHQWWDRQPSEAAVKKTTKKGRNDKRAHALSNTNASAIALRGMLHDRDGYRCRYCGVETTDKKHQDNSHQWDHVDPNGGNQPWNVVVSCRKCNQKKGDAFPWEAGLRLLPPPYPRGAEEQYDGPIPDASYPGMNAALATHNPCTGRPWGERGPTHDDGGETHGSTHGATQGEPMGVVVGMPTGKPTTTHPHVRAQGLDRVGSGSAQGRPGDAPWVNPGSAHGSTHTTEPTDGLSPDGSDPANVRRLPTGGDVA